MPDSQTEQQPQQQQKIETPTLETVHGTFAQALQTQLNDAVSNFLRTLTDEQIDEFLPEDMSELDTWIAQKLKPYQTAQDPSPTQLVAAASTLFFAAFCEELDTVAIDEGDPETDPDTATDAVSGADADTLNDVVGA